MGNLLNIYKTKGEWKLQLSAEIYFVSQKPDSDEKRVSKRGSGKTNAWFNLINSQPDIDKIYLCAKDPYKKKYQYLINKREKVGLSHFNDPKAFIECLNDMQGVHKNIEDYNPIKRCKILIVFDDMIADMINNKKLNPIVTELFIRGRKLNISIVFTMESYFKVPKDVRLNSTHFFIMKIPNKRELQQIALNHSSDIDFKDFTNIFKKYTKEPYSFLVNDITLASGGPLRFRKNLLGYYIIKIMTIEDQIKDEKQQYEINRDVAKISALSSGKIDKYEYLTDEELLPSNQQQIIQQAKFNYSPLGKAFDKQRITIEDQGEKQADALKTSYKKLPSIKDFVPTEKFNLEVINELKRIEEIKIKWFINQLVELMILEVFKQYLLMVIILETMLLVCLRRILNKRI